MLNRVIHTYIQQRRNFKTGSVAHKLLFGIDFSRDVYASTNQEFVLDPSNLFNPVYGQSQRHSFDNTLTVGNRLNNVPENAVSLWTTYEAQDGALKGLGFGFGIFYVGQRQGDLANSFEVPSYTRTDASLFYRRDNFRIGLNIENLFDVSYFETAESRLRVFYGAPLTVRGTISLQF